MKGEKHSGADLVIYIDCDIDSRIYYPMRDESYLQVIHLPVSYFPFTRFQSYVFKLLLAHFKKLST